MSVLTPKTRTVHCISPRWPRSPPQARRTQGFEPPTKLWTKGEALDSLNENFVWNGLPPGTQHFTLSSRNRRSRAGRPPRMRPIMASACGVWSARRTSLEGSGLQNRLYSAECTTSRTGQAAIAAAAAPPRRTPALCVHSIVDGVLRDENSWTHWGIQQNVLVVSKLSGTAGPIPRDPHGR